MSLAEKRASIGKDERISPRERLLSVASELFYRHGIRAIGVERIAEAAETNKVTLYRHFSSKDELVAEYLRRLA
jgi:AcrR family transcriptional regulator